MEKTSDIQYHASFYLDKCAAGQGRLRGEQFSYYHSHGGIGTFKLNSRTLESKDLCMTVKDDKLKDRQPIVGFKCTGNGGRLDRKQLWTIGGSTPRPPTPAPIWAPVREKCGDTCYSDSDCRLTPGGLGCAHCSDYIYPGAHGICVP